MEPTMKRKISPMWEHFELTDSTSNKEFGYNNNTSMLRHYRNLHENKEPPENKSWMKHLFSMIVKNTQPFSIVDDVLMFFLQVRNSSLKEEECRFYCHKSGHVIADCMTLKRKGQRVSQLKGVGLINDLQSPKLTCDNQSEVDACFCPFGLEPLISLTGLPAD
ncbi:uncharacterized protein AB9W97_005718 isoform 1-T1 [Spinachia spinachia]